MIVSTFIWSPTMLRTTSPKMLVVTTAVGASAGAEAVSVAVLPHAEANSASAAIATKAL